MPPEALPFLVHRDRVGNNSEWGEEGKQLSLGRLMGKMAKEAIMAAAGVLAVAVAEAVQDTVSKNL